MSTEPRGARVDSLTGDDEESTRTSTRPARAVGDADGETIPAAKATVEELREMAPDAFLLHNFRVVLRDMIAAEAGPGPSASVQESLNDASQFRQEADRLFKLGIMGLEGRAEAEELFASVRSLAFDLARRAPRGESPPAQVLSAMKEPAVWYQANMSVFRSLPDSWAIGQLFPIVPLHRFAEAPTVAGSLADLTCDSDGRIDHFIGRGGGPHVLCHSLFWNRTQCFNSGLYVCTRFFLFDHTPRFHNAFRQREQRWNERRLVVPAMETNVFITFELVLIRVRPGGAALSVGPGAARSGGDRGRATSSLPLHPLRAGEPYLMAAFLVGAYQDSMGSRGHNLFGSPSVADVYLEGGPAYPALALSVGTGKQSVATEGTRFELDGVAVTVYGGQTTADVLRDVGADPHELAEWMRGGDHSALAADLFTRCDEALFESYTYLEST